MQHEESRIQRAYKRWFNLQYPRYALLLFAVPNGGARNKAEAGIMKAEGVVAGVADMILFLPRQGYHALCLEFKTATGRQSPAQKQWQAAAEEAGYRYEVVRSWEQARDITNEYLAE